MRRENFERLAADCKRFADSTPDEHTKAMLNDLAVAWERLASLRMRKRRASGSAAPDPPALAEFLLTFCARTRRDEFAAGDMNERFARDCIERGRRRAQRLYWANVLGYLLRHSFKLAAIIGVMKRLFG
jgi:hypothetical protein